MELKKMLVASPQRQLHFFGDAESKNEKFLVGWDGPDDPVNPRNWPLRSKMTVVVLVWINAFVLEWASGADSQESDTISEQFAVSKTAESLSAALLRYRNRIRGLYWLGQLQRLLVGIQFTLELV